MSADRSDGTGMTDRAPLGAKREPPRRSSDEPKLEDHSVVAVDTSRVTETRHSKAAELDSLFDHEAAADFRSRWDVVQRAFVDDPQQAVRDGDQLVTEVIQVLSSSFAEQRTAREIDGVDGDGGGAGEPSTENLRQALRRYRSFFDRLLAV